MTPALTFWYASGDDKNANDGSERMPVLDSDVALTSYGFDGALQPFCHLQRHQPCWYLGVSLLS